MKTRIKKRTIVRVRTMPATNIRVLGEVGWGGKGWGGMVRDGVAPGEVREPETVESK